MRSLRVLFSSSLQLATVLCVFSQVAWAEVGEKRECAELLDKSIFDIRNYTGKSAEQERSKVFDLQVVTELGGYSLTARPLPDSRVLYQIIQTAGSDWEVGPILHRLLKEMLNLPSNSPNQERYYGPWISDQALAQDLATMENKLKEGLYSDFQAASGLRKDASLRADAIRALLITFLKTNGIDEEDRFFDVRLGFLHRDLVRALTTKQQVFFDYAIFTDYLGFEAEQRAEQAQTRWRKIDTRDQSTYADVHEGIRKLFLKLARGAVLTFRDQKTYKLKVLDKTQSVLARWRELNPAETLDRLRAIAVKGASVDDAKWVLEIPSRHDPLIKWGTRQSWTRRLRSPDQVHSVLHAMTNHLRNWAARLPETDVETIDRIVRDGLAVEDIDLVLKRLGRFTMNLEQWDFAELNSLRDGKPDLSNLTPFGMDIDHRVANRTLVVSLRTADRMNGTGSSAGTGHEGGYSVPFMSRSRRMGPSYDRSENF